MMNLKNELDNGVKRSLYILVGTEHNMINRYIKKISSHPVSVGSFRELKPKLQNMNLFSSTATYVIKNDKELYDKDYEKINKFLKGSTLILVYEEMDKRKTLFKQELFEFIKLDVSTVSIFIESKLDIDDTLAAVIAKRCNCDMGRVEFECEKLKVLNKPITKQLVDSLIKKLPDDVIFEMVGACVKKQKKQSLILLDELLELKENPIPLLYRNFRNVLLVQGYQKLDAPEIAEKTGINERAVYAIKRIINHYTLDELVESLKMIAKTDMDIKTGRQEKVPQATIALVLKLCRA